MMNVVACRLFSLFGLLLIIASGTGGEVRLNLSKSSHKYRSITLFSHSFFLSVSTWLLHRYMDFCALGLQTTSGTQAAASSSGQGSTARELGAREMVAESVGGPVGGRPLVALPASSAASHRRSASAPTVLCHAQCNIRPAPSPSPSLVYLTCQLCEQMGDYGEHCYRVDLVSNIATNLTSTDRVELCIRRAPIH